MVRGDQRVARECYSASMKQKTVDNVYLDELDMRDEVNTQPEPSEELEPVALDTTLNTLPTSAPSLWKTSEALLPIS